MSLFNSGIRPAIDEYLASKGAEIRDYGDYWSASSAGYCHRKLIFERLGVPPVSKDSDARRTRVFESGHIFHKFIQDITKGAGLSIAQELELQDEELMVRGHIDDLVLIDGRLILYDIKTQHSNAFTWQKGRPPSYFHKLQVGTYMYMLNSKKQAALNLITQQKIDAYKYKLDVPVGEIDPVWKQPVMEARILKISKDDLRMDENQILWDDNLELEVHLYWTTLNKYWAEKKIPPCSCADREGGFMAKEKFNPYFYEGEPCSIKLYEQFKLSKAKEKV